ncbi:hypothetical protein PVK06_004025 [Gossypium arboreum]|uniref:DUF4283 domain-containing protein n=1 Tax=Gossypium arboreum TaxID=29729 RepID=A0ABR0QS65_GOSAR|nr:hypothetical protein PVK06_004025 [Gossypium arboreum]
MSSLKVVSASKSRSADDQKTIKVRFKEDSGVKDVEMLQDLDTPSKGSDSPAKISWKQMFIGKREQNQNENLKSLGKNCDEDLEFLEGDVKKSMVNGILTIEFSECIQQILFKGMETTVVPKLLGRNIGYATLFNRISSLWRPTKLFHLKDIKNDYFLAKLQCIEDYNKALSQGPWIIYGQYLIVQPWKKYFSPMKSYPSMVLAWIRLPGLLGFMYKRRILEEVGGLVDKVVKFDLNTDRKTIGCFARMKNLVLWEDRISRGVAKETNNNEGIVVRLLGKENVGEAVLPVDYTKEGIVPFVNKNRAGEASGLINGSAGHVLLEEGPNFNVINTGHKDSLVDLKIQAKKIKTTKLNLKDGDDLGLQSVGKVAKELDFEQFRILVRISVFFSFIIRVTISSLKFMVEKVKSRLHRWDARQLSLASRVTLA